MTAALTFTEGSHRYKLDGKPVPSVTTLLSGGIPKPALPPWAARSVAEYVVDSDGTEWRDLDRYAAINFLKGIPWQQRDQAGVRGTDVHALAEELVHGREVEVPEHLLAHVQGYVDWLDLWQPKPVLTERLCANRQWWYAGRFDAILDIGPDRWAVDWKTSRAVYGDTALQVAAYMACEFWQDDDGNEQPMPEGVTRHGVVHITDSGTVLHELDSSPEPLKDFLHASFLARRDKQRKGYLWAPVEPLKESA